MCKLLLFRSILSDYFLYFSGHLFDLYHNWNQSLLDGFCGHLFILVTLFFLTISNAINISIKFGLNMLKNQYENESSHSRKLLLIYLPYNFMLLAKKCIQLIGKTNANSLNRCSKCEPFFECHITYIRYEIQENDDNF